MKALHVPDHETSVPWYDEKAGLFGADYLQEQGVIPAGVTREEIDFLERHLNLPRQGAILDLACGHGRHSLELARRGYRVTGQDLSATFLQQARDDAKREGLQVNFVQADMRQTLQRNHFDVVVCLFSSFGYLEDDDQDLLVLRNAAAALRSKGSFVLDVRNRDKIIRNYRDYNEHTYRNGTVVECRSSFDPLTGRNQEIYRRVSSAGEDREVTARIRLYTVPELRSMLTQAGLELQHVFGSYDSSAFTLDSPRCLLVSTR